MQLPVMVMPDIGLMPPAHSLRLLCQASLLCYRCVQVIHTGRPIPGPACWGLLIGFDQVKSIPLVKEEWTQHGVYL